MRRSTALAISLAAVTFLAACSGGEPEVDWEKAGQIFDTDPDVLQEAYDTDDCAQLSYARAMGQIYSEPSWGTEGEREVAKQLTEYAVHRMKDAGCDLSKKPLDYQ